MPELRRVSRVPQSPQEKRMCWAAIPGVTFPKPMPEEKEKRAIAFGQDELPDTRKWVCTAEAAKSLKMSVGGAGHKLGKLGVSSLRARGNLFWSRREVAALAGEREVLDVPPAGWLLFEEASAALGCGRATVQRFAQQGRLRRREALVGGRRRTLFHEDDIAELASLLRQRREIDCRLGRRD